MYRVSSNSVARIWSLGGAEIFCLAVNACKVATYGNGGLTSVLSSVFHDFWYRASYLIKH